MTFGGLPVPGATVTATQGDKQFVAITDTQGIFKIADLADGVCTIRIEMLGFSAISQELPVAPGAPPSTWELELVPFAEDRRASQVRRQVTNPAEAGTPTKTTQGFSAPRRRSRLRRALLGSRERLRTQRARSNPADAADGLLVNGSVNNGAASPFAQLAAFGNNRRGLRSLYNGGIGVILGSSAFDARSFSFDNNQDDCKA